MSCMRFFLVSVFSVSLAGGQTNPDITVTILSRPENMRYPNRISMSSSRVTLPGEPIFTVRREICHLWAPSYHMWKYSLADQEPADPLNDPSGNTSAEVYQT